MAKKISELPVVNSPQASDRILINHNGATSITSVEELLASSATDTEIDALTDRISELEEENSTQADAIEGLQSQLEELVTRVAFLESLHPDEINTVTMSISEGEMQMDGTGVSVTDDELVIDSSQISETDGEVIYGSSGSGSTSTVTDGEADIRDASVTDDGTLDLGSSATVDDDTITM